MAIATTVVREVTNPGLYGQLNLRVANPATIVAGTVLTVATDLTLTVIHELPYNEFQCEVSGTSARGKNRMILHTGDPVTG